MAIGRIAYIEICMNIQIQIKIQMKTKSPEQPCWQKAALRPFSPSSCSLVSAQPELHSVGMAIRLAMIKLPMIKLPMIRLDNDKVNNDEAGNDIIGNDWTNNDKFGKDGIDL